MSEIERLTLAAMSVGIARRCVEVMIGYANPRKTFGVPIREHGQVQRHIAESFAEYRGRAPTRAIRRDAKLIEIGGGTLEAHHENLPQDLAGDPSRVAG